jgi:hypothetical protein
MTSTEQSLISMLQQLPIPITITWQSGNYYWQCADSSGSSPDLVGAVQQSLRYILTNTGQTVDTKKVLAS